MSNDSLLTAYIHPHLTTSDLIGKVVIVAGGSGLLGSNFCSHISSAGAHCIVADIDKYRSSKLAEDIRSKGFDCNSICTDITCGSSVDNLISETMNKFGRIDALVNNAYPKNKNYGEKLEDVTFNDFCENINAHLGGYFLMMQKFAKFFVSQGYGNIVNISSIYGFLPPRFEIYGDTKMTMPVEYAAIKSGVIQLTKYFAQYYKGKGIRVNTISPGGILNGQPLEFQENYEKFCNSKGLLEGSDIAPTLLFLLSDCSKRITGQNLIVDDGFTL